MNKTLFVESFGVIPLALHERMWKVLLILHQQGNHWSFPKGRRVEGEEPIESALRELKEETNLDVVEFLQKTPLLERYSFRRDAVSIQKTVHYYPAIVTGELALQEEEIRDACWMTLEQALKQLTFPESRTLCSYVMRQLLRC